MKQRPVLIIPSENMHREFDAKLLLSCFAAEAGFTSYIGSRHDIHARIASFPRGIYLAKDVRSSSARMVRILKNLGHFIMGWDEEALVYHTPRQYLATRVDPDVLRSMMTLFAWGDDNARIWRAAPGYNGAPIIAVGNPRLDLLRPELRRLHETDRRQLKIDFGDYILVNSSFGTVNHILPAGAVMSLERIQDRQAADRHAAFLNYRRRLFAAFLDAVEDLAERFSGNAIIVRPHPSEDPKAWHEVASRRKNVHVRKEGGVVPWMLGAKAIIHNGCTTAIEAALLGRQPIAYMPICDDAFDTHLPNAISVVATDLDMLADLVRSSSEKSDCEVGLDSRLHRHVSIEADRLCSQRIIEHLQAVDLAPDTEKGAVRRWLGLCQARWRYISKEQYKYAPLHKNSDYYNRQRFPGRSTDEINEVLAILRSSLGRFRDVVVRNTGPNIFEVRAQQC